MSEIVPEDKDWTWTLREACPDCGFEAATVPAEGIGELIRFATAPWTVVLRRSEVGVRPNPATWSPLEYACHVRDVCELFAERTRLILEQDDPQFANWDQDATALAKDYQGSDPAQVSDELAAAGVGYAALYDGVRADQWARSGRRSNGSVFTLTTLGQYGLHDLIHHLWDVHALDHPA